MGPPLLGHVRGEAQNDSAEKAHASPDRGGALRTFTRCVTCLARVGSDLVLQAHPAKLELHTLNSSRSAYASISLARDFFDEFSLSAAAAADSAPSSTPLQCSKTYWIACSAESEVQTLALDRSNFSSRLAIRPRDLARLLSNFQSSLQELTVIATDPAAGLSNVGVDGEIEGKAVELRSYIDPTKDDCDTRLHTQLWIDPTEEFVEYVHSGDPVDVTFGVKELKAFLTFCEGCEVDILLFFQKAGEPVLLVPKFGLDNGSSSDFDATLVLATMLVSQLTDSSVAQQPTTSAQRAEEPRVAATPPPVPENVSNHTKIWSELSGSAPKSFEVNREKYTQKERNANSNALNDTSMLHSVNARYKPPVADNANDTMQPMQMDHLEEPPDVVSDIPRSQHHPSNWVGADEDDDDDEDEELFVQTTPHYMD
uniref:Cell cycle checkpoint control protein RAD9A n=1 Tax=Oryza barthii TaxID=65489 RepID=A0A0D3FID3_9ORYZ